MSLTATTDPGHHQFVTDNVYFYMNNGDRQVRCGITRPALEVLAPELPHTKQGRVQAFKQSRSMLRATSSLASAGFARCSCRPKRNRSGRYAPLPNLPSGCNVGTVRRLTAATRALGMTLEQFRDVTKLDVMAARLVVKILKGDRPGDLPFELPARYELIVNLKTAKAIGLMIPDSFVLLADE